MNKYITQKVNLTYVVLSALLILVLTSGAVLAASTSQFSQTINPGTLATDIRDGSRVTVGSPSVSMSAKTFSFDCQSGGSASTGTFGTATQRIYVDNPDAADNGWTLTLAGSATTALWTSGGTTFDFNDAGGSGCTDGADSDSVAGQLTVNPSVASTTTDYSGSNTTGISLGTSTAFVEGTTNSVTLVTAANTSADIWRGYFTGVTLSQTIPAEQPALTYTLSFSLTATAS